MSTFGDSMNNEGLDPAAARELHALCTRLYDDVITDEEFAHLNQRLNESAAARKLYLRYVELHNLLLASSGKREQFEAEMLRRHVAGDNDEDERMQEKTTPSSGARWGNRWPGRQSRLIWAVAATALVAATLSVFWSQQQSRDHLAEANHEGRVREAPAGVRAASGLAQIARLSYVSAATRWRGDGESSFLPARIVEGTVLAIVEGEVELTYGTGTQMLLVGPAEFVVHSTGGKLLRGGLVASVTEAGHGFTIETPNGKVVDLGTEFGVAVDDFGVSEVSVFKGKVEAFPRNGLEPRKKVELTGGRGLQWNEDDLIPLDADLRRFATSILDLSNEGGPTAGHASLVDQFRSASLDSENWKALGNVRPSNIGLNLIGVDDPSRRPYLISAKQFDPAQGPITIACDFRFVDVETAESASLSILTRSADERGVALHPWSGALASCARCSYGCDSETGAGSLMLGVKMESDRELTSLAGSSFPSPAPGTPYRVVMRDDGVNASFTVSLRDDPSTRKTVTFRSLFRGKTNFVALEGALAGTTLIERLAITQDVSTKALSTYSDFSSFVREDSRRHQLEARLLATLAPTDAAPVLLDDFEAESLNDREWAILGDVVLQNGSVQLGLPNAEGHIDTWRARPYLLTRRRLDPNAGALTILGRITFADNFLSGYGASFSVMTRADDRRGNGPGWENSVLQRGVRANFWPAAWDSEHSLEIHEKPTPNTITLLATRGLQVNPQVRSYLFRVVDDGQSIKLTIVDPQDAANLMTIAAPAVSPVNQGYVGFESCWGSPVILDDIRIYQRNQP